MNKLELYKKKLLYRSSYRGTKEMDILLSNFVKKHINSLNESQLIELDKFLSFEDNDILDFYNHNLIKKDIDKNEISKIFKEFLL